MTLCDADFHAWGWSQAAAIRSLSSEMHDLAGALDWENVAEELDTLARGEQRPLKEAYTRLLVGLLLWQLQPDRRDTEQSADILRARLDVEEALEESPSMLALRGELYGKAWSLARRKALLLSGLPVNGIPATSPFLEAVAISEGFWPD